MAGPAFSGRRARSRSGQLAAFGGVVLVVAASLALLGGSVAPVLDEGARAIVAQSGATAAGMRAESRLADDPGEQDATVRETIRSALRDVPMDVERSVVGEVTFTSGNEAIPVQVLADPGAAAASTLVAGDWPAAADETAVQAEAADALGIGVGDDVVLGDATLTVTGTWRATEPGAVRWFGDPAPASGAEDDLPGPFLVDEAVAAAQADPVYARWTLLPAPGALGVAALPAAADALERLDTAVRRLGGDAAASLDGSLPQTVARATRVTAVAGGVLAIPFVLVGAAGTIVLTLIGRAIASGRGGEFVLLRARGASLRSLTAAAAREAGMVAGAGAIVGTGIAIGLLGFAPAALLPALVVAVLVSASAVLLVGVVTITELRAPVTGRAESGRAAVVASLGPLAIAAIAAALALSQLLSLGAPVVVRADGVVRVDALAVAAPVLVLLTGALVAPVLAGPLVAIAERIARAGRGILPVLPLRQLARRARAVAAGVLVVALATGAVVLAVAFHVAADRARIVAERAATGADVRVELALRAAIEPGRPGAASATLDGVDGVDEVTAVLASTAAIGPDAIPLLAGDPGRLAGVPSAPPGLGSLVDELTAERPGAELPAGARELTVAADLEPGVEVPEGLVTDVVVWLADRDGAALRVPLGDLPVVLGPAEVTGPIPASAVSVLAVEFRAPPLPPSQTVDLALTSVRTGAGDDIAFDGANGAILTSGGPSRIVPQPESTDALPVVLGAELAARLDADVGSALTFQVSPVPTAIPGEVVGILPGLPGQEGSLGLTLDLLTLEARAIELGGSVPAADELWITAADPEVAADAVRGILTSRAHIVTARTLSPGPVLDPTVLLFEAGVAVSAVLAVLGFAAVAAAIGTRRRTELAPLRSLGFTGARIRSARAIELAVSAVLAVVAGAAAGVLTALLVVPGLVGVIA